MNKVTDVFKCNLCGTMIEVLHEGGGELVCCSRPMIKMVENTTDAAKEKHVPVVESTATGYKVKVGSVAHPMEEKHYIEWIQLCTENGQSLRKFLKPGDAPEAEFTTKEKCAGVREYCNLHGLWKS